jgi:hypothetical protein
MRRRLWLVSSSADRSDFLTESCIQDYSSLHYQMNDPNGTYQP